MRRLCVWGTIFWLVSVSIVTACDLPNIRTSDRPGQDNGPLEVGVSFIVLDVLGVDDANQQIEVDIRSTYRWRDERLTGLEGCRFNVTEVWLPRVDLINSSRLREGRSNARNEVEVGQDGSVKWVQRYTGHISSYHNLRSFPFDAHAFEIATASLEYGIEDLVFVADNERSLIGERLNIEGWDIQGIELTTTTTLIKDLELETSTLTLVIHAERERPNTTFTA